jgi:hypothetical protein
MMYSDLGICKYDKYHLVWPVRICSLILGEDDGVFLLKEIILFQLYLLYVLMAPKKVYLYTFIFLCYEQMVGCSKCCSCIVHVLDSCLEIFIVF